MSSKYYVENHPTSPDGWRETDVKNYLVDKSVAIGMSFGFEFSDKLILGFEGWTSITDLEKRYSEVKIDNKQVRLVVTYELVRLF